MEAAGQAGEGRERLGEPGVLALAKRTLKGQVITTFTHQTGGQSKDGFRSEENSDTVGYRAALPFWGFPCNRCPKRL